MTHYLRDAFSRSGVSVGNYAIEYRYWVDERVRSGRADELVDWDTLAPFASRAHPSPEHFLPLFVALGAGGEHWHTETVFAGFMGAALAMDAYAFS
jgi:4,5-DOPA dioxygenase extradiol